MSSRVRHETGWRRSPGVPGPSASPGRREARGDASPASPARVRSRHGRRLPAAGIGGFIPGITSNYDELELAGPESDAKLLGLFEVSILHNIVHLLFAVGLIAAARYSWSRIYLLGGGIGYLGVVLYGALVD